MATEIYLGYPPENIKKWIKAEAEKKAKITRIVYADGTTWEGLIEGVVDCDKLVSIGLISQEYGPPCWVKELKEIIIGNNVTQIGKYIFNDCTQLESVTIQSDKTEHEGDTSGIYINCQALSSFPNSTMKYVGQLFDTGCFDLYGALPFTYNIACKDGVVNAVTNETQNWWGKGFNISFDGYVQQTKTTFIFDNGNRHDIYHYPLDSNVLNKTVFDNDGFLPDNDYLNNVKEIIVGNNITQFETPDLPNGTFAGFSKLETVYLPDNIVDVGDCLFNYTHSLKSLPNTTTEQLVQWIETKIETFSPYDINFDGGAEYTITCKNGIVHTIALGEIDEYGYWNPTSWEITVTPL